MPVTQITDSQINSDTLKEIGGANESLARVSANILKTNFKIETYRNATLNRMDNMIIDTFASNSGLDAGTTTSIYDSSNQLVKHDTSGITLTYNSKDAWQTFALDNIDFNSCTEAIAAPITGAASPVMETPLTLLKDGIEKRNPKVAIDSEGNIHVAFESKSVSLVVWNIEYAVFRPNGDLIRRVRLTDSTESDQILIEIKTSSTLQYGTETLAANPVWIFWKAPAGTTSKTGHAEYTFVAALCHADDEIFGIYPYQFDEKYWAAQFTVDKYGHAIYAVGTNDNTYDYFRVCALFPTVARPSDSSEWKRVQSSLVSYKRPYSGPDAICANGTLVCVGLKEYNTAGSTDWLSFYFFTGAVAADPTSISYSSYRYYFKISSGYDGCSIAPDPDPTYFIASAVVNGHGYYFRISKPSSDLSASAYTSFDSSLLPSPASLAVDKNGGCWSILTNLNSAGQQLVLTSKSKRSRYMFIDSATEITNFHFTIGGPDSSQFGLTWIDGSGTESHLKLLFWPVPSWNTAKASFLSKIFMVDDDQTLWTKVGWSNTGFSSSYGNITVTGRVSQDGVTWSDWLTLSKGATIENVRGKYFEVKVTLGTADATDPGPGLLSLDVTYVSGNSVVQSKSILVDTPPRKVIFAADYDAGAGSVTFAVSRDGGVTWLENIQPNAAYDLSTFPEGKEIALKATLTGNATLTAWGVIWQ